MHGGLFIAFLIGVMIAWVFPEWYFTATRERGAQIPDPEKWALYLKELDVQVMDFRVKLTGAIALLLGGWVGYRNLTVAQEHLRATQNTLKVTQDRLEVDRTSQITNRYTQAITQLGADRDGGPNLEVRLGGIYALERIAKDSPPDHWTVMEVLAAYIRENSKASNGSIGIRADDAKEDDLPEYPHLRTDIQAALTVIGRRKVPSDYPEPGLIDLSGSVLRRAQLAGALLVRANLSEAHLERVNLSGASLDGADLRWSHLERVNLSGASLDRADLSEAHLVRVNLREASLDGADLAGAHVERLD